MADFGALFGGDFMDSYMKGFRLSQMQKKQEQDMEVQRQNLEMNKMLREEQVFTMRQKRTALEEAEALNKKIKGGLAPTIIPAQNISAWSAEDEISGPSQLSTMTTPETQGPSNIASIFGPQTAGALEYAAPSQRGALLLEAMKEKFKNDSLITPAQLLQHSHEYTPESVQRFRESRGATPLVPKPKETKPVNPAGSLAEFEQAYTNGGGNLEAIKGTPAYMQEWTKWRKSTLQPAADIKVNVQASGIAEKAKLIDIPSLAQSVADGQDAPSAIKGSMGMPVASQVKSEILKKYPKFNMTMADANYKWKQSATNQRTINFAGGALPRLAALDDQLSKLPNVDLNTINRVMRAVSIETGKPEYTNYESNRNAIVQEVNTALSGSSQSSDMRVIIELENLKGARSPQQIRGAISNLREALIARMDVDLSPLYPLSVVRGEETLERWKEGMFKAYRGKYGKTGAGPEVSTGGKTIVKQFVSPSTGKTKYVYSDGTEEIK